MIGFQPSDSNIYHQSHSHPDRMELSEILEIISRGEGTKTEFKSQLRIAAELEKREFAKDLSAMANTSGKDGYIIYGVSDVDSKPIGITHKRGLVESLVQIGSSRIEPPVEFEPLWFDVDHVSILALEVPASHLRPHWIKETRDVYVRRHNVVEKAHPHEIKNMMESHHSELNSGEESEVLEEEFTEENFLPSDRDVIPNFFPLIGPPTLYRTCKREMGPLLGRFSPVVFDPQYDIFVPTPEFGDSKSAIAFEAVGSSHLVSNIYLDAFVRDLGKIVSQVAQEAGVWGDRIPMYWSLSRDEDMDYGIGAESASQAIHNKREGVLSCVIHFSRFSLDTPTCMLFFYADLRTSSHRSDETYIDDCWLKLLTSSLPFNPKWVWHIFRVFRKIDDRFDPEVKITDATLEKVYVSEWITNRQSRVKTSILGFMGRRTFHDSDPNYDQSLGLVAGTEPFKKVKWTVYEDWNFDSYRSLFKEPPVKYFDEIPIEVTNPVPAWLDIQSGLGRFRLLKTRQIVVGASGRIMSVIGAHSVGGID